MNRLVDRLYQITGVSPRPGKVFGSLEMVS